MILDEAIIFLDKDKQSLGSKQISSAKNRCSLPKIEILQYNTIYFLYKDILFYNQENVTFPNKTRKFTSFKNL